MRAAAFLISTLMSSQIVGQVCFNLVNGTDDVELSGLDHLRVPAAGFVLVALVLGLHELARFAGRSVTRRPAVRAVTE